ncbi:MAG: hypothetical protein PHI97_10540 [Desulfobulbus sp.]|nr:hypothetical protein [Desulfobulbus sp.]
MKKELLAGLAIGVFLVGMSGIANAAGSDTSDPPDIIVGPGPIVISGPVSDPLPPSFGPISTDMASSEEPDHSGSVIYTIGSPVPEPATMEQHIDFRIVKNKSNVHMLGYEDWAVNENYEQENVKVKASRNYKISGVFTLVLHDETECYYSNFDFSNSNVKSDINIAGQFYFSESYFSGRIENGNFYGSDDSCDFFTNCGSCWSMGLTSVFSGNFDGYNLVISGKEPHSRPDYSNPYIYKYTIHAVKIPNRPKLSGKMLVNNPTHEWSWVSGGGGNGYFRYSLDNSNWIETYNKFCIPDAPLSEGEHLLYVQENDDKGNWSRISSRKILIDTTPPNSPVIENPIFKNRSYYIGFKSGGGDGSGIFRYKFNNNKSWSKVNSNEIIINKFRPFGLSVLYVQESDSAGNWSKSARKTIHFTQYSYK